MDEVSTNSTDSGDDSEYLDVALIVGIPCGIIILLLVCLIAGMCWLILRTSSENPGEVEATYMKRRFQGISLEQQRKMEEKKKRLSFFKRRRSTKSTAAVSRSSSVRAVISENPFKLQDWQLRMTGIEVEDPGAEEGDADGGEESVYRKRSFGAINPLLLEEYHNSSDAPSHGATPGRCGGQEGDSSSSDSFNPYD